MLTIELGTWWAMSQSLNERYNSANWGALTSCAFYKNEEVDRLLAEIQAKPQDDVLLQIEEVQRLVFEDMPHLIMFYYGYRQAYNDKLRGLENENSPLPYPPFPQDLYYGE
jgi:ABC-type transport system substrate-binding protein